YESCGPSSVPFTVRSGGRMKLQGFKRVTLPGFAGFRAVLNAPPWSTIPVTDAMLTGLLDGDAVSSLPLTVQWKLRLQRPVTAAATLNAEPLSLVQVDADWDNVQHMIALAIELAMRSRDAATRAAGERLNAKLLPPTLTGRAATQLSYAQEVDYGNAQLGQWTLASVKADGDLIGLAPHMTELVTVNRALSDAAGVTVGST